MASPCPTLQNGSPLVVASFAGAHDLSAASIEGLAATCDLVEVRLDLLEKEGGSSRPWQHLSALPLLFTARRLEEGGALPLDAGQREAMLDAVLDEASLIDIEVASIAELGSLVDRLAERQQPWIASFHDFNQLPPEATLQDACARARDAGAHVFKLAAHLDSPASLARLAEFQQADHGLAVATMGMGPLAAVSRLLNAQCGSVLNYGFAGSTPTAPGQWSAKQLKEAIGRLAAL